MPFVQLSVVLMAKCQIYFIDSEAAERKLNVKRAIMWTKCSILISITHGGKLHGKHFSVKLSLQKQASERTMAPVEVFNIRSVVMLIDFYFDVSLSDVERWSWKKNVLRKILEWKMTQMSLRVTEGKKKKAISQEINLAIFLLPQKENKEGIWSEMKNDTMAGNYLNI